MSIFSAIDDMWEYWKSLFLSVVGEHAKLSRVRVRKTSLPWIDSALHQLMRARNYFLKKYRKTRDISDWDSYKDLCNQVRRQLRRNKADYFENVCQENVHQPGKAWMEVNKALGRSSKKCIQWNLYIAVTPRKQPSGCYIQVACL